MQDLVPYLNATFPTTQDIKDFINGQSLTIRTKPGAQLLNPDLTPHNLATPFDTSDPADISEAVNKCTVRQNLTQDVQRECQLEMTEIPEIKNFATLTQLMKVYMRFLDESGSVILKVPMGIFGFDIPDRTLMSGLNVWSIKGYDLTREVARLFFLDTFTIPQGFRVTDAIKANLAKDKLPPSQGGRIASGIPWSGTLFSGLPIYTSPPATTTSGSTYSSVGVLVASLGTPVGGIITTPNGIRYNVYSGARVDPTTYVPIDPWSLTKMTQVHTPTGSPVAGFFASIGDPRLWYDTELGVFVSPFDTTVFSSPTNPMTIWDPFRNVGVRLTVTSAPTSPYQSAANPTGWGCPLATWPYDYDGSGPYFVGWVSGAPDPSGGGSVPPTPTVAPTLSLVEWTPGLTPNFLYEWAFAYIVGGVVGPLGPIAQKLTTLAARQVIMPLLTPPAGVDSVALYRTSASYPGTFFRVTGYPGPGPDYTDATPDISLGQEYVVPGGTTSTPTSSGPPPTQTGTIIPWPDLNNPGLTPSGCEDVGPNVPLSRINIPTSTIVAPQPFVFSRKINKLAAINGLLAAINYFPLWVDENGVFRSEPQPYFTDLIPSSEWEYRTRNPLDSTSKGGTIKPGSIVMRITDQTQLANVVHVVCEKNGAPPIAVVEYNRSLNSAISIDNVGFAVVKLVQDDKLTDPIVAHLRALVELQYAALGAETIDLAVSLNPFHQSHDYIEINVYTANGVIEVQSDTYPFLVNSWETDLNTRETKLVAGRIVAI